MRILVTGAAGFIGMFVCKRLLGEGHTVTGVDNLNDYYDPGLKQARLDQLSQFERFQFIYQDLVNPGLIEYIAQGEFDVVVHLAAQAGVRYSITAPLAYADANLAGFTHILEGCRHGKVKHLLFASSSSVYGGNTRLPFSETDPVDLPVSFYAATKRANELMAHSYAHLYGLPVTGLRFFTVYGPWGRPDMAYFKFAEKMVNGTPIDVYNHGRMQRDFTYIDDIVEAIARLLPQAPAANPAYDRDHPLAGASWAPYQLFNIGGSHPVALLTFIETLEAQLGLTTDKNLLPMQDGDVVATCADNSKLHQAIGEWPVTPLETGLARFVDWFRTFYGHRRAPLTQDNTD